MYPEDMVRPAVKAVESPQKRRARNKDCDEIEKAFGGAGDRDGGTGARVFGNLLTWMAEKKALVFVIATANNVANLPPELLRKGRFDELFFVDLPRDDERADIMRVVLRRYKREHCAIDLQAVVDATKGFAGAELDALVAGGLYRAFHANRDLTTADCLAEAAATVPLSITMKDKIDAGREWAAGRAQPAALPMEHVEETPVTASVSPGPKLQGFRSRGSLLIDDKNKTN